MADHMLTTYDNPYNPFTEWDEWYNWDEVHGYHTSSYLARVVISSDDLPENLQDQAIEEGMNEILREDVLGIYQKVSRPKPFSDVVV